MEYDSTESLELAVYKDMPRALACASIVQQLDLAVLLTGSDKLSFT